MYSGVQIEFMRCWKRFVTAEAFVYSLLLLSFRRCCFCWIQVW